jgi:predicted alpha/beta superfamily hydrolase
MNMMKSLILVFLFLLPCISVAASEQKLYEMPGTHVIPIKDTQSNKQYELYIKLPEKYAEDKDKKYPVIYFTDAVWHIELLSAATAFLMEDVILVGISWQKDVEEDLKKERGAHASRSRDYSFKKSSDPERQAKYKFGQASNHLAFIRNDVFKTIESNYRTDPSNRTYLGFSSGGLFGTYALLTQPDTFKNYILGSPSIWSHAPDLFSQENAALKNRESEINVFISHGELEKKLSPHIEDFLSKLKNKKYEGLSSIKHVVIESSGHSDSFPMLGIRSVKWLSGLQVKEAKQ